MRKRKDLVWLITTVGSWMETGVPPNGEASTLEVEFVKIDYSACTRYHAYFINNRGRVRLRFWDTSLPDVC